MTSDPDSTVGIVVVSHSRALAEAAVQLASEMVHDRSPRIEMAAGLDDGSFGTDAVAIAGAIERLDSPAGVVVLMDLGSAVLSAELALDLLPDPDMRDRVILSDAPIVEGLVVVAVAAAGGATLAEVTGEAQAALLAKVEHLAPATPTSPTSPVPPPEVPAADEVVATFVVENPHGLHARPAARLAAAVRDVDAVVTLTNLTTGTGPVPGGSLTRVATLGALQGHEIEVRASGPEASRVAEMLLALAAEQFGEASDATGPATPAPDAAPTSGGPLPGAPGIAIGPARRLVEKPVHASDTEPAGDPAVELRRVLDAVGAVRHDVETLRDQVAARDGPTEAAIFGAHLELLADEEVLTDVERRIAEGSGAGVAWEATLSEVERDWAGLADPYLRDRAHDVAAVREQVLRKLLGLSAELLTEGDGVLVARDLTPADTARLDLDRVHGVVLAEGSSTSHAALLARARDLPLVVAAGPSVLDLAEGTTLALDGGTGELYVDPTSDVEREFRERAATRAERRERSLAHADEPAVTRDGTTVVVAANVSSVEDARVGAASGAEGSGLVRTELLFMDRRTAPTVADQSSVYDEIAQAMGGHRITVRTLDVGGDKPLPFLPVPHEANPFLGLRGLRLSLDRRDVLAAQLSAICDVARRTPVDVMFPMVSTVDELVAARTLLDAAAGDVGLPEGLRVGMMVEVPAAALKLTSFVPHLDFVSIGTNDLTQYALAAERGNAAVAGLSDPLDPGVLALIDIVCRAALGRVEVSVCGDAAGDPLAIPLLLGMGVTELSVSPHAVAETKATVRELTLDECRLLASAALSMPGAEQVRALVRDSPP